jgi:hypothetical protein
MVDNLKVINVIDGRNGIQKIEVQAGIRLEKGTDIKDPGGFYPNNSIANACAYERVRDPRVDQSG